MPESHFFGGQFPQTRLRRLRANYWSRELVAEHRLSPENLIWPIFVRPPESTPEIPHLPGVLRLTLEELLPACEKALTLKIPAVALFPVIPMARKTPRGEEILNPENLLIQGIQTIKRHFPEMGVITDIALDAFTDHGQDGILKDGQVMNDETLEIFGPAAVLQAQAGSDVIAPSDMMDGRIKIIREALDKALFSHVSLLSYAVKYASSFYAPFRQAIGSAHCLGKADKKTYQMDPRNGKEALREAALDLGEGADMLMVKPGLPYLDILYRLSQAFPVPIIAYQVSGEYATLKASSQKGWTDGLLTLMESLIAFKRSGASGIMTYGALEAAEFILNENNF